MAPVYASYYSLPRMRELNIAYSAPLDGKTTTMKRDALASFERVDKALAKARMAAFERQLDLTRVETKPLP